METEELLLQEIEDIKHELYLKETRYRLALILSVGLNLIAILTFFIE